MTETTVHIPIVRYTDPEGQPTCAVDFRSGKVCVFYGTVKLGNAEQCCFGPPDGYLERRGKFATLSLIPKPDCPVWAVKE